MLESRTILVNGNLAVVNVPKSQQVTVGSWIVCRGYQNLNWWWGAYGVDSGKAAQVAQAIGGFAVLVQEVSEG